MILTNDELKKIYFGAYFFEETKDVHAKFRKLGYTLMALENRYVFHSGEIAEKCPLYAPFLDRIADSAVLADVPLEPRVSVGEFADAYGNTYLYVLNRDIDGAYARRGLPASIFAASSAFAASPEARAALPSASVMDCSASPVARRA